MCCQLHTASSIFVLQLQFTAWSSLIPVTVLFRLDNLISFLPLAPLAADQLDTSQDLEGLRSQVAAQGEKVKGLKASAKEDASLKPALEAEVKALLKLKEEVAVSGGLARIELIADALEIRAPIYLDNLMGRLIANPEMIVRCC